ncbi:MAG: S1/P1 nuclease [Alistipes sp.]|nr:S1/P1 nuclease [Alistipes sp.]
MKRLFFTAVMALMIVPNAFGWGQKGHDVVAYVAEQNISCRVARKVAKVLEGHSLVYYANWMDNASHTPEYAHTSTWHYANVDEGYTYQTMPKNENGDVVQAVMQLTEQLKKGGMTPQEESVALRMLIHLVGDLHCPMHAGHKSDLGGNLVEVLYFGKPQKLHSIWDSALVESAHNWGYTEWQREIDRQPRKEDKKLQQGSVEEWFSETVELSKGVYKDMPEGAKISYDEVAKYAPLIEQQLLKGGLRLARLLEEIY